MDKRQVIGPFELEEKLGAGGMGTVYKAKYTKTGQYVALKLLTPGLEEDEKLVARFNRELEILKKLKHPNIVQCYGGGRLGKQRFYAMELVSGGTLSEVLRDKVRFPWETVLEFGLQICAALEHAHENGVVHRDLKPANLIIDKKSGRLKLADFGLARITDATQLTAAGKTLGTFAYMAPEQITGSSPISPKTDLYALGIVLYELLTGKAPFTGESTGELLMSHLSKKLPRICTQVLDCPIWFEKVIFHLVEKDPKNRPRDAMATAQALLEVRDKVAHGASMAEHTVTGEPTNISLNTESQSGTDEAKNLLKRRKKKKVDNSPLWEQTWFLASCLGGLALLITYLMWPLGEDALYARAEVLMKSEELQTRQKAKSEYLDEMLRRFPDGKHAESAKEFLENLETDRAEDLLMAKIKKKRVTEEIEKQFEEAYNFERFGDRVSAIETYESLATFYRDQEKAAPICNLARRRVAELQMNGAATLSERATLIAKKIEEADKLDGSGDEVGAKAIWNSLLNLYSKNKELKQRMAYVSARKEGKSVTAARAASKGEKEETTPPKETQPVDSKAPEQQPPEENKPENNETTDKDPAPTDK
jgi:serine/threonine protein kinase